MCLPNLPPVLDSPSLPCLFHVDLRGTLPYKTPSGLTSRGKDRTVTHRGSSDCRTRIRPGSVLPFLGRRQYKSLDGVEWVTPLGPEGPTVYDPWTPPTLYPSSISFVSSWSTEGSEGVELHHDTSDLLYYMYFTNLRHSWFIHNR